MGLSWVPFRVGGVLELYRDIYQSNYQSLSIIRRGILHCRSLNNYQFQGDESLEFRVQSLRTY